LYLAPGRSVTFAAAQKMRMLILRHLCAESPLSTEPRMSKSGPLRTEQVGHSLTFVALACNLILASYKLFTPGVPVAPLCWWVWESGPFSSLGVSGLTLMERSVLAVGERQRAAANYKT
jgi:hypothetical protein